MSTEATLHYHHWVMRAHTVGSESERLIGEPICHKKMQFYHRHILHWLLSKPKGSSFSMCFLCKQRVFDIWGENIARWQVANHLLALGQRKDRELSDGEVLPLKQTCGQGGTKAARS